MCRYRFFVDVFSQIFSFFQIQLVFVPSVPVNVAVAASSKGLWLDRFGHMGGYGGEGILAGHARVLDTSVVVEEDFLKAELVYWENSSLTFLFAWEVVGGGLLAGRCSALGDLCGGEGLPAGRGGAVNSLLAHTAFQVFTFEKNN